MDQTALKARLAKKRVRICYSLHECCICNQKITQGQAYHDGGYGNRAHPKCVDSSYHSLTRKPA